jgi:ABC-type glutathione transport system ATPase component
VLEVRGLSKTYRQGRWWQKKFYSRALDEVAFKLRSGKTLGVVGESGSGKTTLALCLVGLEQADSGEIFLDDENLRLPGRPARTVAQREIQLIFQDSARALNPRMSAIELVEEPLLIRGQASRTERRQRAEALMERVGIASAWKNRLPGEFSGGQRQRLAIARALVVNPRVLILDEPFVGLDLSMQGQIANLLLELQQSENLSYICISHNLGLIRQIADEIAVMEHGRIVEHTTPQQTKLPGLATAGSPPIPGQQSVMAAGSGARG